jgi:hypothetical protein
VVASAVRASRSSFGIFIQLAQELFGYIYIESSGALSEVFGGSMYVFLMIEFALGLLIGLALRATSTERAQLRFWQSPSSPGPTE